MKKIGLLAVAMLLIGSAAYAKKVTVQGTFAGEICGDACYGSFTTKNGELQLSGNYDKLQQGKTYTVTYDDKKHEIIKVK